jgi:hypothetical protein
MIRARARRCRSTSVRLTGSLPAPGQRRPVAMSSRVGRTSGDRAAGLMTNPPRLTCAIRAGYSQPCTSERVPPKDVFRGNVRSGERTPNPHTFYGDAGSSGSSRQAGWISRSAIASVFSLSPRARVLSSMKKLPWSVESRPSRWSRDSRFAISSWRFGAERDAAVRRVLAPELGGLMLGRRAHSLQALRRAGRRLPGLSRPEGSHICFHRRCHSMTCSLCSIVM